MPVGERRGRRLEGEGEKQQLHRLQWHPERGVLAQPGAALHRNPPKESEGCCRPRKRATRRALGPHRGLPPPGLRLLQEAAVLILPVSSQAPPAWRPGPSAHEECTPQACPCAPRSHQSDWAISNTGGPAKPGRGGPDLPLP